MTAQLVQIATAPDLVDQVYRSLLDAISSGALAPGERITQEDIAQRLAVSRQPVLQALRLLKKDGFVLDAAGRGVLVAPLDADWMAKVYQVRGALDVLAARLAAAQRRQIDPKLIDRGRRAARGRSVQAMLDADMAFHQAIYAGSGNELIAQSADQHWRHLRRAMGAVLQAEPQRESLWDEHAAIAAAIAAGDVDLAARLSDEHGTQASATLALRLAARLSRSPQTQQGDRR
ncbi:GntR family transcriptional regulator [Pseudorhodoferax sp. Leaf267]|uniref:GntR family transcriptional regulator n=1 Tax=Pseudorhodoferax sp. Leaf267 TaxID=1736316 RepID=UPI0006FE9746|nr:GntR family transcriptional regulator [Pseudorhodoferax sp. Leaf267]KQP17798.1 GntR family transcriptional regulator [Pseudorhodoferax sp. Leaf267]